MVILSRINRYMLGCKSPHGGGGKSFFHRINRYMLGCKFLTASLAVATLFELIDTCWDVNKEPLTIANDPQTELIDTCWDVNEDENSQKTIMVPELIDTCWDVNTDNATAQTIPVMELIDTCWDVNEEQYGNARIFV